MKNVKPKSYKILRYNFGDDLTRYILKFSVDEKRQILLSKIKFAAVIKDINRLKHISS